MRAAFIPITVAWIAWGTVIVTIIANRTEAQFAFVTAGFVGVVGVVALSIMTGIVIPHIADRMSRS